MEEVATALGELKLDLLYAQIFEDRGWDDLQYLLSMDAQGRQEVADDVGMKPGHAKRFVDLFGGGAAEKPATREPRTTCERRDASRSDTSAAHQSQPEDNRRIVQFEAERFRRKLGFTLAKGCRVINVKDAGIIAVWNQANPGNEIIPGSEVLEANGVSGGVEEIREQLRKVYKSTLQMTIALPGERRAVACSAASAENVSAGKKRQFLESHNRSVQRSGSTRIGVWPTAVDEVGQAFAKERALERSSQAPTAPLARKVKVARVKTESGAARATASRQPMDAKQPTVEASLRQTPVGYEFEGVHDGEHRVFVVRIADTAGRAGDAARIARLCKAHHEEGASWDDVASLRHELCMEPDGQ